LEELRFTWAAPLPGIALAVLDQEQRTVTDVLLCEDGHAQERSPLDRVLPTVGERDVWIADRNSCSTGLLTGIARRGGAFVIRQHGATLHIEAMGERRPCGRSETGAVSEQEVEITDEDGQRLRLRRIVIRLDEPTRDGETEVVLLTNVRRVRARKLARLYLKRWSIEGLFNVLTTTLNCEQKGLGYPKAALFGFCVTLVAYNALATVKAALRGVHGSAKVEEEVSLPKVAEHVGRNYEGMMVALPPQEWLRFRGLSARDLAGCLRQWAAQVCLAKVRKAQSKPRKKGPVKPAHDPSKPHVSTARLLAARRQQ
jgi:hypothetical protein